MTIPNDPLTPFKLEAGQTYKVGLTKREHFALEFAKKFIERECSIPTAVSDGIFAANTLINGLNRD